jgi:hypothetical protein
MQGDDGWILTRRDLDAALPEKSPCVAPGQRELCQALERDQEEDGEG